MYAAPAVSYPVDSLCLLKVALLAVAALGFVQLLFWFLSTNTLDWRLGAATMGYVGACWAAFRLYQKLSAPCQLRWDGSVWCWQSGPDQPLSGPGCVRLCIDGGRALMLLWQAQADSIGQRSRWFWLERSSAPGAWLALRRAVVASDGRTTPGLTPHA